MYAKISGTAQLPLVMSDQITDRQQRFQMYEPMEIRRIPCSWYHVAKLLIREFGLINYTVSAYEAKASSIKYR
jgi:hypothetical protein